MSEPKHENTDVSPRTIALLEHLDSWAHVVVAVFFLLMATGVLTASGIVFVRQLPYLAAPYTPDRHAPKTETAVKEFANPSAPAAVPEKPPKNVHPFIYASLELLSSLLFAVIILELLRTIITYLQSHDTQAIMKEFLIVGIISSVRKILMVGAESSLANTEGIAFIQESIGVVISVVAILLMIGGLILLRRYYGPSSEVTSPKE